MSPYYFLLGCDVDPRKQDTVIVADSGVLSFFLIFFCIQDVPGMPSCTRRKRFPPHAKFYEVLVPCYSAGKLRLTWYAAGITNFYYRFSEKQKCHYAYQVSCSLVLPFSDSIPNAFSSSSSDNFIFQPIFIRPLSLLYIPQTPPRVESSRSSYAFGKVENGLDGVLNFGNIEHHVLTCVDTFPFFNK